MRLRDSIEGSFVAGLVLITPLVVTLLVLRVLVQWSLGFVDPIVRWLGLAQYTNQDLLLAQVIAAVTILAAVTLLGYVAQWSLGQSLFGNVGRVVDVVPLVSTIYSSTRQVASSLVDRTTAYESVVLVEYPREGVFSIGLVTGESPAAVSEHVGDPSYTVFLPNSPNPTGGRLAVLPADQVHEIDMSVRRGLRLIVTTGIGAEDHPSPPAVEAPPGETDAN